MLSAITRSYLMEVKEVANTLPLWFMNNDRKFGLSLLGKDPEDQGRLICERYGLDFDEVRKDYETLGKPDGDARLLAKLCALDI